MGPHPGLNLGGQQKAIADTQNNASDTDVDGIHFEHNAVVGEKAGVEATLILSPHVRPYPLAIE
jgi:hypothetical protein